MFVSQPQYEFPFPPALEQPGSQHWRMVELTLHAPWFLLSVEIVDYEFPDCSMTRTLCIAWDNDLADVLRSIDASVKRTQASSGSSRVAAQAAVTSTSTESNPRASRWARRCRRAGRSRGCRCLRGR